MTDVNPFRSDPDPLSAPPVAADQVEQDGGSPDRKVVVGLAALAAVALAGGAFLFLGGDDGADEFAAVTPAARPAATAPAIEAVTELPAQSRITLGRNPFRALYVEPAPAPPAAAPQDGVDPSAPPAVGGQVPIVLFPPETPGSGGGTAAPAPAPAPQQPTAEEHQLVLLRVFGEGKDQSASFSIDGKQQTAKVGTTFGPTAEILLLSLQQGPKDDQWTAVLQVGDGDPFDVVTGEPVFVR